MKVTAQQRDFSGNYAENVSETKHILVRSNPLGALRRSQSSITVRLWDETFGMWSHNAMHYQTITDFLSNWHVVKAETRHIRVPFLRYNIGLGDAFAFFAERLPLWFKAKFNGCIDRREWWNWLLQFTPLQMSLFGVTFGQDAMLSQAAFDYIMDIRRALRARGVNPYDLKTAPLCDACKSRTATHVVIGKREFAFIVCDEPHCQERITQGGTQQ